MRVLSLWILLFLVSSATAQEKQMPEVPDYKKIEKTIKDKESPWYYPKLMKRYQSNDTTLTAKDYHYLYYGYFFNDSYSAMGSASSYSDSIRALNNKKVWLDEDKKNYLKFGKEMLKESPFQVGLLIRVGSAYRVLKDEANAALYRKKCIAVLETIRATGDGLKCETGYHVLNVPDEYELLQYLGYESGESQSLTPDQCDYLKLKDNDDHLKGLYFDVKQLFKGYSKMFDGIELETGGKKKKK